ncbi:hypothetical protein NX02_04900 [Sphingomonas sanxanigenens DSM 19645 = NX02]|uniref:Uncharacterized protein n=1 Tax=Sphingomonas sanxanigenens DSM 19645 = NX02 TaxID=1123269 RepID=W0A6M2_9SPHN|nr:hypothetical protein NX02_04900 [Sphingomonas sanxanigenens DSM 19645 = NX02]
MRLLAVAMVRLAARLLPGEMREWGQAMRHEVAAIGDGGAALRFAFGCLGFASGRAILAGAGARPRRTAAVCAVVATASGLAYLAIAGAPLRYIQMNLAALIVGLAVAAVLAPRLRAMAGAAGAALLLLLALPLGVSVNGATRWLALGGVIVQPSLMLVPLATLGFARERNGVTAAAMIVLAGVLAAQPDRAMAGALAAAMLVMALRRFGAWSAAALAAAAAAFLVTMLRPDTQPAMPYVDRIIGSSFAVHPLAGVAVIGGLAVMLLPAVLGWRAGPRDRDLHVVFGAVWIAIILAAALGDYPTPLVGYGGSAIIGYALSLAGLPGKRARGGVAASDLPPRRPASESGTAAERRWWQGRRRTVPITPC